MVHLQPYWIRKIGASKPLPASFSSPCTPKNPLNQGVSAINDCIIVDVLICPYGIIRTKAGSRMESGFLKFSLSDFRSFPDENNDKI
jgi:hypothetical protein